MGNTYLRIPDTLIRKSFQEVYDELSKKVEIKTTGSGISIATANALYSMNIYGYQQLQQDLKKGVSLVFKDITEFDETFPSAIAIGDIELNEDSTVKYGSRGVAITKNGLAGFDETYNGAGDLPSFSLDTHGNLYLRGEVHAESGTFAGELKSAYGTFDTITAGILQNSDGSNRIDLNASGSQYFITLGWLDYLRSDGRFRLGNGTLIWDGTTFKLTSTDDTPNEVRNFNFDNGENYWVFDDDLEHSVILYTQAPTDCPDVYTLKVRNINEAAENKTVYQIHSDTSDYIETAEAEEFTLICYGATDIGSHATFDLSLDYYDDNGYISSDYETFTPTANWQKFVMRAKTPNGATKAQLTLTLNNPQYMAEGYIEQDYVEAGYTEEGYILQDYVEQDTAFVYLTDIYLKRTRFGDDRVEISGRDISFYKTLETQPYKTVKKIESGVANNGDIVNLTGFYDRQPKIIVSPYSSRSYDYSYDTVNQQIEFYAKNLNGDINTGEWSFEAVSRLVLQYESETLSEYDSGCSQQYSTVGSHIFYEEEKQTPENTSKIRLNFETNMISVGKKDTAFGDPDYFWYHYEDNWEYKVSLEILTDGNWVEKAYIELEVGDKDQDLQWFNITLETADMPSDVYTYRIKHYFRTNTSGYRVNTSVLCSTSLNYIKYRTRRKQGTAFYWTSSSNNVLYTDGSLNWIAIG